MGMKDNEAEVAYVEVYCLGSVNQFIIVFMYSLSLCQISEIQTSIERCGIIDPQETLNTQCNIINNSAQMEMITE